MYQLANKDRSLTHTTIDLHGLPDIKYALPTFIEKFKEIVELLRAGAITKNRPEPNTHWVRLICGVGLGVQMNNFKEYFERNATDELPELKKSQLDESNGSFVLEIDYS